MGAWQALSPSAPWGAAGVGRAGAGPLSEQELAGLPAAQQWRHLLAGPSTAGVPMDELRRINSLGRSAADRQHML